MKLDDGIIAEIEARLNGLAAEELEELSLSNRKQERADFAEFEAALKNDRCSLCGNPISHFSIKKPCLHWLLKPKGFKPKHLPVLYATTTFHHMDTFLRWAANSERLFQNINDLVAEKSSDKFIEHSIRFRNLEWAFSCAQSDRQGHASSQHGQNPHFHFQMQIDGRPFIRFNSFHLDFREYDEFCFAVKAGRFKRLRGGHFCGAGMQDLIDRVSPETLIELSTASDDPKNAAFDISTLIVAPAGERLTGDALRKIIETRKKTGRSFASIVRDEHPAVGGTTIISPGEGVAPMRRRSSSRGRQK
ncbi:hypothetical protein V0U79_08940 [Hyphobacterium sp. HN65]|uniref:Cwf19-like C-terminal domain-containing protein n=1 Tax=Hyphobacterium lacteum TaxID=3116575 RepID=A0ABU7LRE3_9PROT|nr:hypothetical protein [Hyphobacterium sp. HN65]MEE2526490.1 hypothetical protein [Hyphobacterium sp. HN65]